MSPGVKPPRLLHKAEPKFTSVARSNWVQGTVVLQLVVDEKGAPKDITLISPLGFGLDENAIAAVQSWQFAPGEKNGVPVPVIATAEVNFRFLGLSFEQKFEERRTRYNEALAALKGPNAHPDKTVQSMEKLAKENFPPAMYSFGTWQISGELGVPKDQAGGEALIRKAADKDYGPALYQIATRLIRGQDSPPDVERGLKTMQEAATLGSEQAQYYLGQAYRGGVAVPKDTERAKRNFRLCAARGVPACQLALANLMIASPVREGGRLQAVAWIRLAADQGLADARAAVEREQASITPEQDATVRNWMNKLVHK